MAVYPNTTAYYLPLQHEALNASCLDDPSPCNVNGTCVTATLVGTQKFPSAADRVELRTCLETGYELCEVLGLDGEAESCSYTTCSGDACNTPPPISCPACSLPHVIQYTNTIYIMPARGWHNIISGKI